MTTTGPNTGFASEVKDAPAGVITRGAGSAGSDGELIMFVAPFGDPKAIAGPVPGRLPGRRPEPDSPAARAVGTPSPDIQSGHDRDAARADPDRTRFDGRDGGPGRRAVRRLDPAGRPQLPDLRPGDAAPLPAGSGARQARRRGDEPRARAARRRTSRTRSRPPPRRSPTATTTTSSRSISTRRARAHRPTPT